MSASKKKPKYKVIKVDLPADVIAFYRKVAKTAGVTLNQAMLVVIGVAVHKTLKD